MQIIKDFEEKFKSSIEHLKNELGQIRTGRANPALVDGIVVDYYGTKTPLNQMANISIPDPKSIVIQPWDKNASKDIEKAINASSLGLNPVNEGDVLRIPIPQLTEERRKEIAKIVGEKIEQAKISIRNIREDIWKKIKELEDEGKITEDDMFQQQKELQKVIDENNKEIEQIGQDKEKEIMTI